MTKQLLQCSNGLPTLSKLRLDWLLDQKNKMYGCIYNKWFNHITFVITKAKDCYKLVCLNKSYPYVYYIMDIEKFLEMVGFDEITCDDEKLMDEFILKLKDLPITGVIMSREDKLFLYDCSV